MKTIIIAMIFSIALFADEDIEFKLHHIFNVKLVEPLKLSKDQRSILLEKLDHYSKEAIKIDTLLKANLNDISHKLSNKKSTDDDVEKLNEQRIGLVSQLNVIEKRKLNDIKNMLSAKKFSYFMVLKEKLIAKFKKAVKVEELAQ